MPTRFNFVDGIPRLSEDSSKSFLSQRRRSLLTKRSNSQNLTDNKNFVLSPRLPTEILDEIIKAYFNTMTIGSSDCQLAIFREIKPLTLVSSDFRCLVLQRFFQKSSFQSAQGAQRLFDYLATVTTSLQLQNRSGGFTWVRNLSMPAFLLPGIKFNLSRFQNLQDLGIDGSHCILSSQTTTLARLFDTLSNKDPILSLRSFIMTNVPRLDEPLLEMIAKTLPWLVNLHLSTVEGIETSCCRHCYEKSLSNILHSPIKTLYSSCEDMAKKMPLTLKGFHNLKNLHLGVLLSPYFVLEEHTRHDVDQNDARSIVKSVSRCPRCSKYAQETRRRELSIGLAIADSLLSLETISWTTIFSLNCSNDGKLSENYIECDAGRYPNSLQYSIIKAGNSVEDFDDDRWKIICFGVRRGRKVRLSCIS